MAKYLLKVSYNSDGIAGVMKAGGTSRVTAVKKALGAWVSNTPVRFR